MQSTRLAYEPLSTKSIAEFHDLIQDEHIRQYLCDGEVMSLDWCRQQVADSRELFKTCNVGLWLVNHRGLREIVGFCGFLVIPSISNEPQLVYALLERWTGQGYATEMARAAIEEARASSDFGGVLASVDTVNTASVQILEKLGFSLIETQQGAFGDMQVLRKD